MPAHPRNARSTRQPASGKQRDRDEAPAATRSRRRARRRAADTRRRRRSAPSAAARSRRRCARGRRSRPRPRTRGCSSSSRARRRRRATAGAARAAHRRAAAVSDDERRARERDRPQRARCGSPRDVRPAAGADPAADRRAPASTASTPAAAPADSPRRSCRKSTAKPTTHSCGASDERAAGRERQTRASRKRRTALRARLVVAARPLAQDETADDGARRGRRSPSARSPARMPPCMHERRQCERDGEAADRDRGLADAEREPALRRAGTSDITARPLADWTLAPAKPATRRAGEERPEAVRLRREQRAARAAARRRPTTSTTRSPNRSVASPHGTSVRTEPDERRRDEQAGLREREVVARRAARGAITATPNQIAEYVACANVPPRGPPSGNGGAATARTGSSAACRCR